MPINPDLSKYHDTKAGKTPDRKSQEASRDSFPASDAPAETPLAGSRAVSPGEMMENRPAPRGGTAVTARFPGHEQAKLAVEEVVRQGPVERRRIEMQGHGVQACTVIVHAEPDQAKRVGEILRRRGGTLA